MSRIRLVAALATTLAPRVTRLAPAVIVIVLVSLIHALASGPAARAAPGDLPVPAGWYAGDLHMHWPDDCWGVAPPESILAAMPPDLAVASVLIWGAGGLFESNVQDYFRGRVDAPVSTPERIVHYDLEVSAFGLADHFGHLGGLNLETIDFPQAGYAGPIQDWAHAQGALIGTLHCQSWWPWYYTFPPPNACCIPYELPVDVALGRVDYLDYQGPEQDGWRFIWYHLLNCGFRLPMLATSDAYCLYTIGEYRSYARVDGPLSYQGVMDAVAAGRVVAIEEKASFVDLAVDGIGIGGEVTAVPGDELEIAAHAYLPEGQLSSGTLEILRSGRRIAWRDYEQIGGVVTLEVTVQAARSAWFAARTAHSHTSPVYVIVDGQPIRAYEESPDFLARYCTYLEGSVIDGSYPHLTPEDEAALLADIAAARTIYETILSEVQAQIAITPGAGDAPGTAPPADRPLHLWPNPFARTLEVELEGGVAYGVAPTGLVRIHAADGRLVRLLYPRPTAGGRAVARWDGRDARGREVPSGVYHVTVPDGAAGARVGRVVRVR